MRRPLLVLPALLIGLVAATTTHAAADTSSATVFADTAGTFHEQAVSLLVDNGIVQGCGDGLFCSSSDLTRGQFGTMLVAALGLDEALDGDGALDVGDGALDVGDGTDEVESSDVDASGVEADTDAVTTVTPEPPTFTDIGSSVHGEALALLAANGILNGCGDDQLCPNDPLTRGQLATLLVNAFELPAAPADATFFIDGTATHRAAMEALAYNGVAAGCGPVTFCTQDHVLRSHAAVFIARAMGLIDPVTMAPFEQRLAEHEELERQRIEQERLEAEQRAEQERVEAARLADEARVDSIAARGQAAVEVALAQVGKPYQWAAAGPHRFDCSGLVYYSWRQAAGITLPRSSRDMHRALAPISRAELMPGDLVFYHSPVSHVSIYLGGNRVVDAPGSGRTVMIREDGLTRRGVVGFARPGYNR